MKTKRERYKGGISDYAREMQALGRVGMVFTEERKKKISESMKGKIPSKRAIEKRKESTGIKIQTPDGTVYRSFSECARELKMSEYRLKKLLGDPNSGYKIITKMGQKKKVIDPEGNIYPSVAACAKYFNRDRKCIKNWIENYPEKGFRYYTENDNTDK